MPRTVERLRKWFAITAMVLVLLVTGFYFYGRLAQRRMVRQVPPAPADDVLQSTENFAFSKSEGSRTLFTIKARRAVRFKGAGRAELHDVNIVVYGRKADRFDQIYGAKFVYEPETGEVRADGEVHLDLEAYEEGPSKPDQSLPAESKNPIHLKTYDLVFNQNTGMASTDKQIEFRLPQAIGTAQGVSYDSGKNELTLRSRIEVTARGPKPVQIIAESGVLTGSPRQAVLQGVTVTQQARTLRTDRATIHLREDNTLQRVIASGNVRGEDQGAQPAQVQASHAQLEFSGKSRLQTATLTGNVSVNVSGDSPLQGKAGRVVLAFAGNSELRQVKATEGVQLAQSGAANSGQSFRLDAAGIDLAVRGGKALERAVTSGASQIEVAAADPAQGKTTVTAASFTALFGAQNRLRSLIGAPNAKIMTQAPGQPVRTSESREVAVQFGGKANSITSIVQEGEVRYRDGERTATAGRARYTTGDETLVVTGSPRLSQGDATITADTLRLNRRTGDVSAQGNVKTTYSNVKAQPGGAMLSAADPIHATAAALAYSGNGKTARYTGGARLWQGANMVQAPSIEFDQQRRRVAARGTPRQPVTTVFLQPRAKARPAPVRVTAGLLTYDDQSRKVIYEQGVMVKGADGTITAERAEITLAARGGPAATSASEVQSIVAQGDIVIDQGARRAQGTRLVYTGNDGKFELTGAPGKSPSIFDAELGQITGDSLTFFSRDDRVLVGSAQSGRTVTQTRVKDASNR